MKKRFMIIFPDGRAPALVNSEKQVERYVERFASDADRALVYQLKEELVRRKWDRKKATRSPSTAENSYVRYTGAMNKQIASLVLGGLSRAEVAKKMKRSEPAIDAQVRKMGLSFSTS
jgi:hypothetical protein